VFASLDRLDHRLAGAPEADYVFEARKWRLRFAVITLLTLLSLTIALVSSAPTAGWLLTAFAVATGVKTFLARKAWKATAVQTAGRWFER
jgi:hypothetical protein